METVPAIIETPFAEKQTLLGLVTCGGLTPNLSAQTDTPPKDLVLRGLSYVFHQMCRKCCSTALYLIAKVT